MRAPAIFLVLLAAALTGCDGPPPSDDKLLARFHAQRGQLEDVRQNLCAIAPQTIWTNSSDSRPPLAAEKRAYFLSLMKEIGATRIEAAPAMRDKEGRGYPCFVEITFWSTGMLDSGDDRAFVHDPHPDDENLVVRDLSAVDVRATVHHFKPPSSHGHRRYLRRIEGGWWLSRNYWE